MRSESLVHNQHLILCTILISFCLVCSSALSQTSTWNSGAGNWSPCPNQEGTALWDTCSANPPFFPQGPTSNAVINGGPVNATSVSIANLTIGSGGSLVFPPGVPTILDITGTSILNNGSISLAGSDGMGIEGNTTVTLSGSGSVTMAGNNFTGGNGNPTLIVQQPVHGFGVFSSGLNLNNQNVISASGGTLFMQPTSAINTGTMEAMSGGILTFPNGSPVSWNNTGGTIEALNGGTVNFEDGVYTGGTLTTVGTGLITGASAAVLNNLTNSGTFQVLNNNSSTLQNTITNTGTIEVPSQATLFMTGNVTLTGAGSLLLTTPTSVLESLGSTDTLTNQQLIHGQGNIIHLPLTNKGTISADSSGNTFYLAGAPTTNSSTMQASGGGILHIKSDSPVLNTSNGVIQALTGSTVVLEDTISGGTLTTSGTGTIQSENATLDGTVNIPTNTGKINVKNFDLFLQGTVNNKGTIALTGSICLILNQPSTLTGTGKLTMASTSCIFGSGNSFTNQSTILGAGSIGDSNQMPITNANFGSIIANSKSPLTINPASFGFTNTGKLVVNPGSTMNIWGLFNTLSGGTLMSGTYLVSGTLNLQNSVVTNDASITLTGSTAEIANTNAPANALQTLAANGSTGVLSLQKGQALATGTSLTNAGKIMIGAASQLTLAGSYTQTAGALTVDGTITAPTGLTLQKGTLVGTGTLVSAVTSDASVTAGDSTAKPAKLSVTGSYSQNSTGSLNISIGGTNAGQFGELAVTNGVVLGGTLSIKLVNGFVPTTSDTFTIVTGSVVTGKFATVKGTTINSNEHFVVNYNANSVVLSVQ